MSDKLEVLHEKAMQQFNEIQLTVREEREQCLEDRRFYSIAGAQWEGKLKKQFENKPKFEVNKVHLAVIRIINEYRNNRIGVEFISKDGSDASDLADKCADLFRADEQDSVAEEAYDNAFEEAVGGGFGAFRLTNIYEDEEDDENDYQRIRIEPIYDADSCVFFDLNAKRQDKSDAMHCFVLTAMTPDAFEEEWDVEISTVAKAVTDVEFDWFANDVVYVAEYYKVEHKKETVSIYVGITGEEVRHKQKDFEDDPMLEETLEATGFMKVREKKVKCKKIRKYILSGNQVLDDCGYIAGKNIPIIPVYGKRWFIDGIERCMGHVRLCKDAQRLKNMQLSKLGEISALSSVSKPIVAPEQVLGHELMWAMDNEKNYPYLLMNSLKDAMGNPIATSPTAYTQPPQVPPAMAALLQVSEQDLIDILGNQGGGDEIEANTSGKAVELVQNRLDMQSFIYISNFAKAKKREAEIWLSMASELYVEEGRKLKTVGEQGEISSTDVARPVMNDDGDIDYEADLSRAKFDIAVDIGPTSSSKKSATVRALQGMLQFALDPQTADVISSMIMMNMEGEGISDVREFFRKKMIRIGAVKPTEEEQEELMAEMQNQQPDPQTVYLQAEAQKSEALATKAQADTTLTLARQKETIAKTAETLARIDRDDQAQAFGEAEKLFNAVSAQPQQVSENQNGFNQ